MADLQQPYAPIDTTLETDSPSAVQANIPAATNFADDPATKMFCTSELLGIITRTKSRRRNLEDEWLAIQRLRMMIHDGGQKYKGRSNVYLPNYANAHGTLVSQLSKGLFPSDDYMDIEAHDFGNEEAADQVKTILKYELDCNARIRSVLKPMLSQLVDHGVGVGKYWYRTGNEFVGKKGKGQDGASFKAHPNKGLTVSARSVFNVVVYPETAENEDDILITAEFMDIDRNYLLAMGKSKRWVNVDQAQVTGTNMGGDGSNSQYSRDQVLLDVAKVPGMSENIDQAQVEKPTAQLVNCIECYASIRLPKSAYVQGEDSSMPVPARIFFINGIPVEVTRNPHYDQKHPYLWVRQGIVPGSFYGSWAGRRARYLQYLINDLANQTNDTGIIGLNPFMVVDTNLLTGPLLPYAPGRVFHTRDVKNAIAFQHPPMEPVQYGQQLVGMYASALVDGVGAPPVLQGVGKSGETATGQSILQRNALSPLQDVVEDIEAQFMIPLLERAWRLIVQYTDRAVTIPDAMGQMQQVHVEDLDSFEYNFRFLASSQAANSQVRAQQAIQMLQILPGVLPLLQMNQYMVNPAPVLKKLYSDGFGWRQFEQFIFKAPMQPGMVPGQPPGAPGQVPPEAQTEVRGSEQNAPSGEMSGEPPVATEDFGVQRSITDEINAMDQGKGLG